MPIGDIQLLEQGVAFLSHNCLYTTNENKGYYFREMTEENSHACFQKDC